MKPWGTRALKSALEEFLTFSIALCFWLDKKSFSNLRRTPETPDILT